MYLSASLKRWFRLALKEPYLDNVTMRMQVNRWVRKNKRRKKDYSNISIKMDRKAADILEAYCSEKGMTGPAVIERAVLKYCNEKPVTVLS